MPGSTSHTEKNQSTQDSSSSTNQESGTSSETYKQELTLTDKLNKRLLVSYLERLNNESKEAEEQPSNDTDQKWVISIWKTKIYYVPMKMK